MASGNTHDKFNLTIGSLITGALIGLDGQIPVISSFVAGWLLATLIFGPDTDLMPKSRTRFLRFFLYPYSILFRHRGISHSLLFGTLTRIFYGFFTLLFLIFIFWKMGFISINPNYLISSTWEYLIKFDYSILSYRMIVWFFAGMFVADFCHVLLDKLWSLKKIF